MALEERFMTIGCLCYSKVSFRGQIKPLLNTHTGHLKELNVIFNDKTPASLHKEDLITTPTTRPQLPYFLTGAKETV